MSVTQGGIAPMRVLDQANPPRKPLPKPPEPSHIASPPHTGGPIKQVPEPRRDS